MLWPMIIRTYVHTYVSRQGKGFKMKIYASCKPLRTYVCTYIRACVHTCPVAVRVVSVRKEVVSFHRPGFLCLVQGIQILARSGVEYLHTGVLRSKIILIYPSHHIDTVCTCNRVSYRGEIPPLWEIPPPLLLIGNFFKN